MTGSFSCVLTAALLTSGCYSPTAGDCAYTCSLGGSCPSGLSCESGFCREEAHPSTSCTTIDANESDGKSCTWPITPTNFDPCEAGFPPVKPGRTLVAGTIDTDSNQFNSATFGDAYSFGGVTVLIAHLENFRVPSGVQVTVRGKTPLLIVVEGDVTIDGTLDLTAGNGTACNATSGAAGNGVSPGGGGGGYGAAGGVGGGAANPGGLPGDIVGDSTISPLVPSCPGSNAAATAAAAGIGGKAGSVVQFSSRTMITVSGTGVVSAFGAPGGGGKSAVGTSTGGGGGGAGGGIFFEAPMVLLQPSSRVCATGAGGGEGASSTENGADGVGASCTSAAGGNGGSTNGGNGGNGGIGGAGNNGMPNGSMAASGGGGGGGAGKIRFHAMGSMVNGIVAPAYVP